MASNKKLGEILAYPQCHGNVRWDEKLVGVIYNQCKLPYEVKNDIPIMFMEEVKKLT